MSLCQSFDIYQASDKWKHLFEVAIDEICLIMNKIDNSEKISGTMRAKELVAYLKTL